MNWFRKTPPTLAELALAQLQAAEKSLLDAESEAERANHTVQMLAERVQRLKIFTTNSSQTK